MTAKATLQQREKELQVLLPTTDGRRQLEELAARYGQEGGRKFIEGTSLITFILVYERDRGMISS